MGTRSLQRTPAAAPVFRCGTQIPSGGARIWPMGRPPFRGGRLILSVRAEDEVLRKGLQHRRWRRRVDDEGLHNGLWQLHRAVGEPNQSTVCALI